MFMYAAWFRIPQRFLRFVQYNFQKWRVCTSIFTAFKGRNFPLNSNSSISVASAKSHEDESRKLPITKWLGIAVIARTSDTDNSNEVEENIAHLLTVARIALEKGDLDRAEAILDMGLKISEDHQIYVGLPYIYDLLTSIALAHGDVEKAENLLVNAVEKMIQIGLPENNHHIIDFKLRLSRIYSSFDNKDWAEIGFKTCLDAQKLKINNGDVSTRTGILYVNVLFWYGVHMIRNEKYAEAKKMLNTAFEYSTKIKGLSPYQEMVILYTLADLHMELEEYDIALQKMQNAILLGKGISSIDLPRCYIKLAAIYTKMGVVDQAKASALEGQKLARLFNNIDVLDEALVVLAQIKLLEDNSK